MIITQITNILRERSSNTVVGIQPSGSKSGKVYLMKDWACIIDSLFIASIGAFYHLRGPKRTQPHPGKGEWRFVLTKYFLIHYKLCPDLSLDDNESFHGFVTAGWRRNFWHWASLERVRWKFQHHLHWSELKCRLDICFKQQLSLCVFQATTFCWITSPCVGQSLLFLEENLIYNCSGCYCNCIPLLPVVLLSRVRFDTSLGEVSLPSFGSGPQRACRGFAQCRRTSKSGGWSQTNLWNLLCAYRTGKNLWFSLSTRKI